MDEKLRRVFDRTRPSSDQKEAMLSRLLESERKSRPMRKLKKLTVVAIAAALMVLSCAAAVVTGMDQRLLDYFGAGPEQEEQLSAAAATRVQASHTYDSGWTVCVSQVLSDRYMVAALIDLTAPEGMAISIPEGTKASRELTLMVDYRIEDKNGNLIGSLKDAPLPEPAAYDSEDGRPVYDHWDRERARDGLGTCEYLESSQPERGRISVLWQYVRGTGFQDLPEDELLGAKVSMIPKGVTFDSTGETICFGEEDGLWSYDVTLSETDSGDFRTVERPLEIGGYTVTLKTIYLSPLELVYAFQTAPGTPGDYGIPLYDKENRGYAINMADGSSVTVKAAFSHHSSAVTAGGGVDHVGLYPVKFIDPAGAVSFTLFGQTYELK